MYLANIILEPLKLAYFRCKWRIHNKHNFTYPGRRFPFKIVDVGKFSYGPLNIFSYGSAKEMLKIGNFVSIGDNVKFILGGEHSLSSLSTYPFKVQLLGEKCEALSKGPIIVEDDVWIGFGVIVLSGVTIGKGAVVGAGSVIAESVPPYAVVAGNPAKVIGSRFEEALIKELKDFNFSKLNYNFVKSNLKSIYVKLDLDTLKALKATKEY